MGPAGSRVRRADTWKPSKSGRFTSRRTTSGSSSRGEKTRRAVPGLANDVVALSLEQTPRARAERGVVVEEIRTVYAPRDESGRDRRACGGAASATHQCPARHQTGVNPSARRPPPPTFSAQGVGRLALDTRQPGSSRQGRAAPKSRGEGAVMTSMGVQGDFR